MPCCLPLPNAVTYSCPSWGLCTLFHQRSHFLHNTIRLWSNLVEISAMWNPISLSCFNTTTLEIYSPTFRIFWYPDCILMSAVSACSRMKFHASRGGSREVHVSIITRAWSVGQVCRKHLFPDAPSSFRDVLLIGLVIFLISAVGNYLYIQIVSLLNQCWLVDRIGSLKSQPLVLWCSRKFPYWIDHLRNIRGEELWYYVPVIPVLRGWRQED